MGKENLGVVRHYDYAYGPNYTDSVYNLGDKELAQSENVYWDGKLKTIPGLTRIVSATIAGTTHNITGITFYPKKSGSDAVVVATDAGRLAAEFGGGTWTTIKGGLNASTTTFWNWIVFNDTLIALSGANPVQKWGGSGGTVAALGGSPPQSKYASQHAADYLFFAGHSSNPSEIRYSDTRAHETWPIGNTLVIGPDDGEVITGLQRFGEATAVFKQSSIWMVGGAAPSEFTKNSTPSDVGCIAPRSIVLTDLGIFFWSAAGPALFNGYKSRLLTRRLRTLLDEVDHTAPYKISAVYHANKKQVLVSYARFGQTYPDRVLILDLMRITDDRTPPVFWPVTAGGFSSSGYGVSNQGIRFTQLGHSSGHATRYDLQVTPGTTWNTATITPRIRTGAIHLGKPDKVQLVRDITLRTKAQTGRISVRYSVDGNQTFATHAATPYSTANSGYDFHQKMLQGDGTDGFIVGNILQLDVIATGSTGYEIYGIEVGTETDSRRTVPSP